MWCKGADEAPASAQGVGEGAGQEDLQLAEELDDLDRVEVVSGTGARDAPPVLGSEERTVGCTDQVSTLAIEGAGTRSIEGHGHVRAEVDVPQDSPTIPAQKQEGESVRFPDGFDGKRPPDRRQAGRGQNGDQNGVSRRRH